MPLWKETRRSYALIFVKLPEGFVSIKWLLELVLAKLMRSYMVRRTWPSSINGPDYHAKHLAW